LDAAVKKIESSTPLEPPMLVPRISPTEAIVAAGSFSGGVSMLERILRVSRHGGARIAITDAAIQAVQLTLEEIRCSQASSENGGPACHRVEIERIVQR